MNIIEIGILVVIVVLPLIAQSKVNSNYNKYSKVANSMNMTGEEVAKKILEMNGLNNIKIGMVSGSLTDHYDPTKKVINLSESIYSDKSIAAAAVAAHECGHAIQDKESYAFLRFRSNLVPVVNFSSKLAPIFLIIGFSAELLGIAKIGIILLSCGLLFQLITLPVEFNASARAKRQLKTCGMISKKDNSGMQKVLSAAALTYVASFLTTALQIFRMILMMNRRN